VKNLAQVKKGDTVVASYVQAVAVTLQKPGSAQRGISTASEVQRAKPGEKPAAVVGDAVTVTATITNVDTKTQMVTLQGPQGGVVDLKVKDPAVLQTLKAGDLVEATYTEALAIAVEAPSKKK
jgi:Cu/Ag efflux protein CusF